MNYRTLCVKCHGLSYGMPICSRCRRKVNNGRIESGRRITWNNRAKVFEAVEFYLGGQDGHR